MYNVRHIINNARVWERWKDFVEEGKKDLKSIKQKHKVQLERDLKSKFRMFFFSTHGRWDDDDVTRWEKKSNERKVEEAVPRPTNIKFH